MKNLSTLILVLSLPLLGKAQLLTWVFTGQTGSQATQTSTTNDPGISAGTLERGSGLTATSGSNSMNSNAWLESTGDQDDVAEQITENDYYQFTLPIISTADVTTIVIALAASSTGPDGAVLRSDQDAYASNIGSIVGSGTLTATINQTGLTGTITYRLYGTKTTTTNGATGGTMRITSLVINGSTPLPVELRSFTAKIENSAVNLNWHTATEKNSDFFAIEKSTNGRDFSEIGTVKGAGLSASDNYYTFTDNSPAKGTNYYRLRQVDIDGTANLSQVVNVQFGTQRNLTFTPTLIQDQLTIVGEQEFESTVNIQVYDLKGNLITQTAFEPNQKEFNISADTWPQGTYIVQIHADQFAHTEKVIKQ